MERRVCKICSKVFSNGRALGGHMRSHLVTLQIPPKQPTQFQLSTESSCSVSLSCDSSSGEVSERGSDDQEKVLGYGLRENPKRSFRLVDPEFLDHGESGLLVQETEDDGESESVVTRKNKPTRKRSKRTRKMGLLKKPSSTESVSGLEPLISSISDQISTEEDVALCLMMLSRDVWSSGDSGELKPSRNRYKYECETCDKVFDSFQALGGHKTSHRKAKNEVAGAGRNNVGAKLHECPFCYKVFGSGQALGGHKRSHLLGSSTTTTASNSFGGNGDGSGSLVNSAKAGVLDLNLPAPMEEQEDSAVSDAEFHQYTLQL